MTRPLDLLVIGSGSAAQTIAHQCRAAGWQVAIVDSRPFGGTCALRGCDPKRVLAGAAEAVAWGRRLQGKGILAPPTIDWPALMRFKRTFTDPVPAAREDSFRKAGITAYHGRARFVTPTTIRIGEEQLEPRRVAIAAGAKPVPLAIPGAELLTTSEQFLDLDTLPRRITFVGGGYVSFEFAHIAVRAGAEVTILHRDARPLAHFDPDLVEVLVAKTRALGVRVELDTPVRSLERTGQDLTVRAGPESAPRSFLTDLAVHGAGRIADIDDMNLDAGGVTWNRHGVAVNEFLQSISNPSVYAAGDAAATAGAPLTPVAGYEGQVVAANLLHGNHTTANYAGLASVVFTVPPLATAGLSEQEAKTKGLRFRTHREDTSGWYSSRRVGENYAGFKVLIEEDSNKILGAHLLGPGAEETINLFALAIRSGLRIQALADPLFTYPTHASNLPYLL
ncbi:MAG: NAD(P)/FAD-dependent oxidoreductase [Acidobacteria bacterium]|nr:MAG: NAD(P)/FAD-dependent oxidoreductase [Acidobacteriota bacterium]